MRNSILIGQEEIIPKGIFGDHVSHNTGRNHETHIEYPDNREITLPLSAKCEISFPKTYGKQPQQAIFGNWNGKGIFERAEAKERTKNKRKESLKLSFSEENRLKNREYYYGKKR